MRFRYECTTDPASDREFSYGFFIGRSMLTNQLSFCESDGKILK